MTIYYLYLKVHKKTGLRYLGQTKQNPFTYKGSGLDWTDHLKLHGSDVDTTILLKTESRRERDTIGRYYSKLWNVVNAQDDYGNKIYANRIPETGGGGGKGQPFGWRGCPGTENGMHGTSRKGKDNPFYGKKHTTEYIESAKQRITHNTGKKNIDLYGPERAAQIAKAAGNSMRGQKRGKWVNDGLQEMISKTCPAGYTLGRLKK